MAILKKEIMAHLKKTTLNVFNDLGNYAQSYITEEKRDYPRVTIRTYGRGVTGKIAKSPRDMVDSGETRDSFAIAHEDLGNTLTSKFSWNTPQAVKQYVGSDTIPPYPFVNLALNSFDIEKSFQHYWNQV